MHGVILAASGNPFDAGFVQERIKKRPITVSVEGEEVLGSRALQEFGYRCRDSHRAHRPCAPFNRFVRTPEGAGRARGLFPPSNLPQDSWTSNPEAPVPEIAAAKVLGSGVIVVAKPSASRADLHFAESRPRSRTVEGHQARISQNML